MDNKQERNQIIRRIIMISLLLIIMIILLWPKKKYVEVIFDTNGGTPVENYLVKENTEIILPTTTKTGYTFAGWYEGKKHIKEKSIKPKKDIKLIAKWILSPITSEEKPIIFEISFDTNGGNILDKIEMECGTRLILPPKPHKEKYIFISWMDQYGNRVNNGDLLACENQTLTARWEKKKEYTCPDGYTLEDKKCILTMEPEKKCKKEELASGETMCLADYQEDDKCGAKTIYYQNGAVEKTPGEYLFKEETNTYSCYYGVEENIEEDLCINTYGEGHFINNKCFVEIGEEENICPSNHIYYTEEQIKRKTGLEDAKAGCYQQKGLSSFCKKDYELVGEKCIKTIPATEKK